MTAETNSILPQAYPLDEDAGAYQRLLDLVAQTDAGEGVRQGSQDMKAGRSRPAAEVFEDLRVLRGIPR